MAKKLSIVGQQAAPKIDRRALRAKHFRGRASVITLGCAKNQVDSEVMAGVLKGRGYEMVSDVEEAEVAVVNTCGFLESSIQESLKCIRDVAALKKGGKLRRLVVAGCLVNRMGQELRETLPDVDSYLSIDDILKVGDAVGSGFETILDDAARPYFLYDDTMPRCVSTGSYTAYVKVSEGCNRPCTFCIIPKIRGAMRSRTLQSVVQEVETLGAHGVREVNLVAQDLTSYGSDIQESDLTQLLRALNDTQAVPWIRLLYAYPVGTTEELLRTVGELPNVCDYFDIPLQHSSEAVLRAMKRPIGKFAARKMVEFIHKVVPQMAIRTTFIVGFPGETEEDVRDLEQFVGEGHFMNVGVFTYSREAGTPSFGYEGQIAEEEKAERRERVMLAQQRALEKTLASFVGQTLEVLVEGVHPESDQLLVSRSRFQAPEVDGTVIINRVKGKNIPESGTLGRVEVTQVAGYDLIGTYLSDTRAPHNADVIELNIGQSVAAG